MTCQELESLLREMVEKPRFVKRDVDGKPGKETFCNIFVQEICHQFGIFVFDGRLANEIVDMLKRDEVKGWRKVTDAEASMHALHGGLAVAGKKYPRAHGHVAIVFPDSPAYSGAYRKTVPMLANVGHKNGIMKMSYAFAASKGEPGYWIYLGREDA